MKNKYVALGLSFLMVGCLLTACGSQKDALTTEIPGLETESGEASGDENLSESGDQNMSSLEAGIQYSIDGRLAKITTETDRENYIKHLLGAANENEEYEYTEADGTIKTFKSKRMSMLLMFRSTAV